jgi:hypothetical protein
MNLKWQEYESAQKTPAISRSDRIRLGGLRDRAYGRLKLVIGAK